MLLDSVSEFQKVSERERKYVLFDDDSKHIIIYDSSGEILGEEPTERKPRRI